MVNTLQPDVNTFVELSVTLTQIDKEEIAPFADKVNLKQQYLDKLVQEMGTDLVNALFQRYNDLKTQLNNDDDAISDALLNPEAPSGTAGDFQFMARNILKMWYLGAWYPRTQPGSMNKVFATQRGSPTTRIVSPGRGADSPKEDTTQQVLQVISSDAYIRGFAWRAMQAHPMGYSEWSFGYWENQPQGTLDDFLPLDTSKGQ